LRLFFLPNAKESKKNMAFISHLFKVSKKKKWNNKKKKSEKKKYFSVLSLLAYTILIHIIFEFSMTLISVETLFFSFFASFVSIMATQKF
jgi:hypothetical protein